MVMDNVVARSLSPAEEVCTLVAGAAALFYWAEKDDNPGVKDYWDALHYVSTSLSVGYANLFPMTPLGKVIASVLMTVGPALAAHTLDGAPAGAGEDTVAITKKLDEVIAELQALPARLAEVAHPKE
jgi:voltage-gated potassium channel